MRIEVYFNRKKNYSYHEGNFYKDKLSNINDDKFVSYIYSLG